MNLKMEEHEHFLQMAKERQREQKREENAEIGTDILSLQNSRDGSWSDLVGPIYATSMACVILQIPYQYLPIFER